MKSEDEIKKSGKSQEIITYGIKKSGNYNVRNLELGKN